MSHAPADVEEFLGLACQAVDRQDYARAIAYVRRAYELAPMRQDIKEMLASLLVISSETTDERVTYREGRNAASVGADEDLDDPACKEPASLGQTSSFGVAEFIRTGSHSRSATVFPDHDDDLDPIGASNEESNDFAAQVALRIREGRSLTDAGQRCDTPGKTPAARPVARVFPSSAQDQTTPVVEGRTPAPESRVQNPAEAPLAPRKQTRKPPAATEGLDLDTGAKVRHVGPRLPGRYFASIFVYSFIALFVAAAGAVSHFRLIRGHAADRVSAQGSAQAAPNDGQPRRSSKGTEQEILRLAEDYLRSKRFDDAITLLAPSGNLGIEATLSPPARQTLARAYEGKATELLQKNLVEASVPYYRKAAELNPESANAKLLLGNALYFCGLAYDRNSKEAKRFFADSLQAVNESLELDRGNLQAYERLASVYEALQQNAQARAALDKIVQIAPASPAASRAQDQIRALSMSK
ncbi:MAG: hypothetical protein N2111_06810 [Candidatus Sumerlaeaceae bacterium]|nr:hypothetical protein [Candidatus Sumerlaeaceae bacterium]